MVGSSSFPFRDFSQPGRCAILFVYPIWGDRDHPPRSSTTIPPSSWKRSLGHFSNRQRLEWRKNIVYFCKTGMGVVIVDGVFCEIFMCFVDFIDLYNIYIFLLFIYSFFVDLYNIYLFIYRFAYLFICLFVRACAPEISIYISIYTKNQTYIYSYIIYLA